jgi:membrane-associated phospholipid phosphatase
MQKIRTWITAFFKKYPHALWGFYLPVYLIMYFIIEKAVTGPFWDTAMAIDYQIPFVESFVLFYDSWHVGLVLLGLYLIFKDGENFRRYMWFIAISYTVSTLICIFFPSMQSLRPAVMPRDNVFTWLIGTIYAADTCTNVFPSVHIAGVVAAVSAVWHTPTLKKWYWRGGIVLWGIGVAASTVLIKQHALVDVIAAFILGAIVYVLVYVVLDRRRRRKLAGGQKDAGTAELRGGADL